MFEVRHDVYDGEGALIGVRTKCFYRRSEAEDFARTRAYLNRKCMVVFTMVLRADAIRLCGSPPPKDLKPGLQEARESDLR